MNLTSHSFLTQENDSPNSCLAETQARASTINYTDTVASCSKTSDSLDEKHKVGDFVIAVLESKSPKKIFFG